MPRLCSFSLFFFVLALLWSPSAEATPLAAAATVGSGMGIQIKGGLVDQEELDYLYKTGFRYVRFSIGWEGIEQQKGQFDWDEVDDLVIKARQSGLKMVIPLLGGNSLYDGEVAAPAINTDHVRTRPLAPQKTGSVQAYARFAAQAVLRYGSKDIIWEIWNEPDLARFWPPKPDVQAFAVLADVACQTMRSVAPEAIIVGPALGRVPDQNDGVTPEYLNTFLASSATKCLNAVSVHPYRHGREEPEAVFADYATIYGLMARNRVYVPLVNTEWGYTTTQVSEELQADYVMRTRLLDMMWGVPLTIWYEWKDSRSDPKDPEGRFGLIRMDRRDKPSMEAVEDLLPIIRGARLERQIQAVDPRDVVLLLREEGKSDYLVGWTLRPDKSVQSGVSYDCDGQKGAGILSSRPALLAKGKLVEQVAIYENKGEP